MNVLPVNKRVQVLSALVEGNSIRATVRMTGVAKNTVAKLLVDVGAGCAEYQHQVLVGLPCKRVQFDEIWPFCYAKKENVPAPLPGQLGCGDVWTWVGIDADTKLVPSWLVGLRDAGYATEFVRDLAGRLANRVQLTSDGLNLYLDAVADGFPAGSRQCDKRNPVFVAELSDTHASLSCGTKLTDYGKSVVNAPRAGPAVGGQARRQGGRPSRGRTALFRRGGLRGTLYASCRGGRPPRGGAAAGRRLGIECNM